MPGMSGLQLPVSVLPDCASVHVMIADAPLNRLSMRQVPEKSAANAALGASAISAISCFTLMRFSCRNGAHHTAVEISSRSRDPCRMSTPEESAPLAAAPTDASPPTDAAPQELPSSTEPAGSADQSRANLHDALSPAVRRLVRQFDLDITGIHGSGPE